MVVLPESGPSKTRLEEPSTSPRKAYIIKQASARALNEGPGLETEVGAQFERIWQLLDGWLADRLPYENRDIAV